MSQWPRKKVLCVCAQGLVRSPTMAYVLAQEPWGYDTRSAGVDFGALIPVTQELVFWAEQIICAQPRHARLLETYFDIPSDKKPLVVGLDDPGVYYRDPELEKLSREKIHFLLGDLQK